MRKLIITFILIITCTTVFAFVPQKGDLLFQDTNCGDFCDGIDDVTIGYNNNYVSHVGLVIESGGNLYVIEAISPGVVKTPLSKFLSRSLDEKDNPRVMVGRLKKQYQYLIPAAVSYAIQQLGKPYNSTFVPSHGTSFYCSELIYSSFIQSPASPQIFHQKPMNFANSKTHKTLPVWQSYYDSLKATVPQGVLGSNPGQMSRESSVEIIYYYGKLRTKP